MPRRGDEPGRFEEPPADPPEADGGAPDPPSPPPKRRGRPPSSKTMGRKAKVSADELTLSIVKESAKIGVLPPLSLAATYLGATAPEQAEAWVDLAKTRPGLDKALRAFVDGNSMVTLAEIGFGVFVCIGVQAGRVDPGGMVAQATGVSEIYDAWAEKVREREERKAAIEAEEGSLLSELQAVG